MGQVFRACVSKPKKLPLSPLTTPILQTYIEESRSCTGPTNQVTEG
jgi:hypothetical protein